MVYDNCTGLNIPVHTVVEQHDYTARVCTIPEASRQFPLPTDYDPQAIHCRNKFAKLAGTEKGIGFRFQAFFSVEFPTLGHATAFAFQSGYVWGFSCSSHSSNRLPDSARRGLTSSTINTDVFRLALVGLQATPKFPCLATQFAVTCNTYLSLVIVGALPPSGKRDYISR